MGESERERKVREIVTGENLERTRERERAREKKFLSLRLFFQNLFYKVI